MINKFKKYFLDLFFPRQCISCKKSDTWLCSSCFSLILPSQKQCCYICKKESPKGISCARHRSHRHLDRVLISAHYSANPILKNAIKTLKYRRHPEDIAEKLGTLLTQTLRSQLTISPKTLKLIPIPLHQKRLKERGFNQSKLLAKMLSKALPVITSSSHSIKLCEEASSNQLVIRTRYTIPQAQTKTRLERIENLRGAFELTEQPNPTSIYMLIDDVITTGATLEECCSVLKKQGAQEVWGLVLARN